MKSLLSLLLLVLVVSCSEVKETETLPDDFEDQDEDDFEIALQEQELNRTILMDKIFGNDTFITGNRTKDLISQFFLNISGDDLDTFYDAIMAKDKTFFSQEDHNKWWDYYLIRRYFKTEGVLEKNFTREDGKAVLDYRTLNNYYMKEPSPIISEFLELGGKFGTSDEDLDEPLNEFDL